MESKSKSLPGSPPPALLLFVGAAVGAMIALAMTSPLREKLWSPKSDDWDPMEVLDKIANALQRTRDSVVEAVDSPPAGTPR